MRTRLLAATLTAFAAVSLAACSSSGSNSASGSGAGSGTSTSAAASPTSAAASAAATPAPGTASPTDAPTGAPTADTSGGSGAAGGPAPAKPAPPTDAGMPAKPGSDVTAKLVAALDAIDPAIVGGKPDQAVDRARNQCQSMYQFPKDKAKLVELANQRFTAPDHPQGFGPDKAAKINEALRATLCPPPA
ncbi:hypothetical protein PUR71_32385 [Streptomyces sp. SP17BM10]|uniref:hypothetical protein n=1 Tax=Streptomyces sp. SP17BM10 TaxID=3002530 RepID=UPI002E781DCB|nr:hypothetical protein [Streptomyces sp. SP17BM10]MEE1787569.1 hypothetical protein [Streptomyces sp. SP17BM10]